MFPDPRPIDPEWLLGQREWLFRLARSLVGDASAAEDLVQETWLAALVRPPAAAEGGRKRAFLATILRRAARATRRGEAARRERERARSREEAHEPEVDGFERLALQRRLATAVLELGEPQRTAIVLCYVEGLTPREIAARTGESSGTVRARLSRGLALLRERLDREHGGERAAWSALLSGWLERPTPSPGLGAPLAGGLIAMKLLSLKLAAAAALVVAVVLWSTRSERGASATAAPIAATSESATPVREPGPSGALPASGGAARVPAQAVSAPSLLTGRVRSRRDHALLPGATVELRRPIAAAGVPPGEALRELEARAARGEALAAEDLERPPSRSEAAGELLARALTDAEGTFAFERPREEGLELVASAAEHVTGRLALAGVGARALELVLAPAADLEVRLLDSSDRGVAGQFVELVARAPDACGAIEARPDGLGYGPSDASGRVLATGLPAGCTLRVGLVPRRGRPLRCEPAEIVLAEGREPLVLRVENTGALTGEAAHPDGAKIYALFRPDEPAPHAFRAPLENGAFLLEGLPAGPGTVQLDLVRLGTRARRSLSEARRVVVVAGETTDVGRLALPDVVHLSGHVRDWGEASTNDFVELCALRGGTVLARTTFDGDGRFELELAAGPCVLELLQAGRLLGSVRAEAPDEDLELDLAALAASLRGRVPEELADTPYFLPLLPSGDPSSPGFRVSRTPEVSPLTLRSGRFRLLPVEPGPHALLVALGARGAAWIPHLALERGRETDVGTLVFGFGTVEGRLAGPAGEPGSGRTLTLVSPFEAVLSTHAARRLTMDADGDADGAFRFEDVPAGPWRVRTEGGTESASLDVFPGATVPCELAPEPSARLLLDLERAGAPAGDVAATLERVDEAAAPRSERTDRAGHLSLELAAGEWRYAFGEGAAQRTGSLRLAPGEVRSLSLDLEAPWRAFVLDADEPELVVLDATAWSLCGDGPGAPRRARACRGLRFELDVEPGAHLLRLEVAGAAGRGLRFARADVPEAGEVSVRLGGITPTLRLSAEVADGSPPRVRIAALGPCAFEALELELQATLSGREVRYAEVPAGTRLLLRGAVPGAGWHERALVLGPGDSSIEWPPQDR